MFRRARVHTIILAILATLVGIGGEGARAGGPGTVHVTPSMRTTPAVIVADVPALLAEIRRPGAAAVLVNVWATWCDPCRAEMPRLAQFFRAHRADGLRLVLISADDEGDRASAAGFLAAQGLEVPSWLKRGDDRAFIDALDPRWTGALPASFLFDGKGHVKQLWQGEVTQAELERGWSALKRVRTGSPRGGAGDGHARTTRRSETTTSEEKPR